MTKSAALSLNCRSRNSDHGRIAHSNGFRSVSSWAALSALSAICKLGRIRNEKCASSEGWHDQWEEVPPG
jgi:hypothetical protein